MSKKQYESSQQGISYDAVPLAYVHWFVARNVRRTTDAVDAGKGKEPDGVFESIRDNGWSTHHPATVELLPVHYDKRYNAALAIAQRKEQLAVWESKEATQHLATVMRRVWIVQGKFIEPLFAGVSGNRRALALPAILADKVKLAAAEGKSFDPASFTLPVVSKYYVNESERIIDAAMENESRTMSGVKNHEWADRLSIAKRLADLHGNESVIRRAIGVGNAQKAFRIVKADNLAPSLNILDRAMMPRPEKEKYGYAPGGYIPAASVGWQDLEKVLKDASTDEREGAADEKLEAYIQTLFKPRENAKAITQRTVYESARDLSAQKGSPMAFIIECHLGARGIQPILEKYPELFKAGCVLSLADDAPSKAPKAKAKAKA